MSKKIH